MKDILDIVYDASKRRMLLSDKEVLKIVEILININNIEVINEIHVIDRAELIFNKVTLGHYLNDKIYIYYSRIIGFISGLHHRSNFELENKLCIYETVFRINLFILFIIMHEIEHAIQEQITVSKEINTFENRLINLENDYLTFLGEEVLSDEKYNVIDGVYDMNILDFIRYKFAYHYDYKLYISNYEISYLERLADVNALSKILKMIEEIKNEIKSLYLLQENLLLDRRLQNYDNSKVSPTVEFFNNIYGPNSFDYSDMGDLSLDKRLDLGMPITGKEFYSKRQLLLPKGVKNGKNTRNNN